MKWEIFVSNTEFFPWLPHKGTMINIDIKNMINENFGIKVKTFNQMNIIIKIKDSQKNLTNIIKKHDKKKIKCFKCNKYGHFANDCKVKQKINQLQINDK